MQGVEPSLTAALMIGRGCELNGQRKTGHGNAMFNNAERDGNWMRILYILNVAINRAYYKFFIPSSISIGGD